MERLPRDVSMDILCRLDVKCLLRFRCLSKPFCSLIDSQEFVKLHLKRSIETDSNRSLILSGSPATPIIGCSSCVHGKIFSVSLDSLDFAVELDHPFKNCKGKVPIIESCNGLIALRSSENDWRKDGENDLVLWNPSTKKHLMLPKILIDFKGCHSFVDGFGYDAASDDYKFVRIIQFGRKRINFTEVAVYSLKTNSWRRFRVNLPYHFNQGDDGTFADGHVYWFASKNHKALTEDMIIALDLKSEEFHKVQLPYEHWVNIMFVGTFKGCLYFSCFSRINKPADIWVMKDSWVKLPSIAGGVYGYYLNVLAYSKSGEEVLVDDEHVFDDRAADHNRTCELLWYNLQEQRPTTARLRIHGVSQGFRHAAICVDSLVSLTAYTGGGVQR